MSLDSQIISFREQNQSEVRFINYFWIGVIIYSSSYTMNIIQLIPSKIYNYLQILGLLFIIPSAYQLIHFRITNSYLRIVFTILCFWYLLIIIRGIEFNKDFILGTIVEAYTGIFLYFVPLVLLFPLNFSSLRKTFDAIIILSVVFVMYVLYFIQTLLYPGSDPLSQSAIEYFAKTLSIPCGFILFTQKYHTKRISLWALIVMLITLAFAIIRARRGLIFISGMILFISAIFYFSASKGKLLNKYIPLLMAPILIMYSINFYQKNKSGVFSLITERIDEDTRTGVELYFYADMEVKDWIIGRGMSGTYYCPLETYYDYDVPDYRTGVETDYLTIILKGGIISLSLLLLITVPAMIKGIFFSKNALSKAAGVWIFLWLISLYPTTVTTFTMNYILVWISVGVCYSTEIRNLSDDILVEYFRVKPTWLVRI